MTGDQFIDDAQKVLELREKFSAHVIEMEAFAIASIAREYNMLDKCIFIKAISDGADNDAIDAHMGNLDFAMQNSLKVLEKILLK
ncbi:5'-methylthioadenosine/S-adenosylhomocysteine nucleosidase [bacterium]|nr:5'-methylthioadenosine/S-adenosylhomocysteine nucleosidase [bacterium]